MGCVNIVVTQSSRVNRQSAGSPVSVWIHGRAYVAGSGANYPADALVNASGGNAIVVTFNYRLGVFGFLASAELAARASDGSTGNYGMADQRLALQWVHEHIEAFGSDPKAISIFGESAGGNSVLTHLTQPQGYPVFYTRAIVQSGTYSGAIQMAVAEQTYQSLLGNTNCTGLLCLLNTDALTLAAAFPEDRVALTGPVIDRVALAADPFELLRAGAYNRDVHVSTARRKRLSGPAHPHSGRASARLS